MNGLLRRFSPIGPFIHGLRWADGVVLIGIAVVVYVGAELAAHAPAITRGPAVSLQPSTLPLYAALSVSRMALAYALSLVFTLVYGYAAAKSPTIRQFLLPLLDVLQSVPILSFLPVVLLGLATVLPERVAAEAASVVLIFTSQAWNMTFSWYQSLTTVPGDLREASAIFRFNAWLSLKHLELPFGAIGLLWNSIMSWAGGWFFLMAAEMFTVGQRDFRLPGIGSYLQTAADRGDMTAIGWGLGTLILVIVGLDQLVWRPLLVWADRFKLEMVSGATEPSSWFFDILRTSAVASWFTASVIRPIGERLDAAMARWLAPIRPGTAHTRRSGCASAFIVLAAVGLAYGAVRAVGMLLHVPADEWTGIALGLLATLARVAAAMAIALAWTVPVGVALATNRKIADWLQPVIQITASVPATALFPVLLLFMLGLPGGLNIAAVMLMLMGTQWYLLFNVIAGASAIPQDLKYTSALIGMSPWERWRTLVIPALFPYIITGAITASGGAWNASIVAEYSQFGGKTVFTAGIGSMIARATAAGNYPLLLAATLAMIVSVVLINRVFWHRLYRLAETRYRIEG
ncbi:MAG: ABC transporter permease subunit [Chthonomonadales bacterium]|nr:ABC transporter permease subunit [Chthonomonadales bacterium]